MNGPLSLMHVLREEAVPGPLRIAWRTVRRSPTYTVVMVLSLGLGIGLCAAAFSIVNGVLLRPVPYDEPDGLVQVWAVAESGEDRMTVSPAMFQAWDREGGGAVRLAAHNVWQPVLSSGEGAERLTGELVTPGLLDLLGIDPVLGAGLVSDHGVRGNHRVVLLGHDFWQRRFGGDRDAVGSTITLDGAPHLVIGVLPADFHHPDPHRPLDQVDVFAPLVLDGAGGTQDVPFLRVLARLGPDASPSLLESRLDRILAVTGTGSTSAGDVTGVRAVSLQDEFFRDLRRPALLLMAATGLVLLIIVTNVSHLVLIRAHSRMGEVAIRRALGARLREQISPLLWEGVVLAAGGAVAGIMLVLAGEGLLRSVAGRYLPTIADVSPGPTVLLFALTLAAGLGLVLVILPALSIRRFEIRAVLAGGSEARSASGGSGRTLRRGLGTVEVALAVSLLIGTALLTRSYLHLNSIDPGFGEDGLAVEVLAPTEGYPAQDAVETFYVELERRIAALPGVTAVGRTSDLPLVGQGRSWELGPAGGADPSDTFLTDFEIVGPGFFEAAGIPVAAGREFAQADAAGPQAVIVNESLARRLGQGGGVVGSTVFLPDGLAGETGEVIGIVGDVLDNSLGSASEPRLYLLHGQWPERRFVLFVSLEGPSLSVASDVRRVVAEMDPGVPILSMRGVREIVDESLGTQRLAFASAWGIGLLALFVAVTGVYGMVSYLTELRTREMAIRSALGADAPEVVRQVLGDALAMLLPGVALGIVIDLVATRVLLRMIFGIGPLDPPSFVLAPLLVIVAGLVACLLPARRAAGVDPMEALRHV